VSWIARMVCTVLVLAALLASAAGVALYATTGHERSAWLAIGGLAVLCTTLGWWLRTAARSRRKTAIRREAIAHLELLARLGKARLRLARLANEDAAMLSERYAVWDREVRKVIDEQLGDDERALFDGIVDAAISRDAPEVTARWRASLDRLDLILRQG